MKRIVYFMFPLFFLLFLTGCSGQQAAETDMLPQDMAAVMMKSQTELPELKQITSEDEEFETWLSVNYAIQPGQVTEGVICYGDSVEASEIAVLRLTDQKDGKEIQESLDTYIRNRAAVFEGYAPQQASMAKEGITAANGSYLALIICPAPSEAKTAFLSCFGKSGTIGKNSKSGTGGISNKTSEARSEEDAITASPLETEKLTEAAAEDTYDSEAVLQAWRSGDESSLSEMNRRILDAAKEVIASEIDDGMSDYDKELAIHDWITGWSSFDYSVFGRSSEDGFAEGSDTPYGVFIDRSAMCHGYSSAFQLLMDMLDIECITVFGIPGSNGVEHSWNMVRLDGDWYCVDAAWDDPIGGSPGHTYFNVTSEYLRKGSIHRWDEDSVPEAVGTAYAYH